MGQRLMRIRGPELTPAALQPYLGREVDLCLQSGSSHHGRLAAVDDTGVLLTDLNMTRFNRKKHRHRYAFSQLTEVLVANATLY
jgi:hypothetical protein